MNAQELMAKARRALASSHKLLQDKDGDGACNRAYYAMFDAARAALIASKAPVPPEIAKTHSGLIAEVRLYDRLFLDAQPDAGGRDFIEDLNPNSLKVVQVVVEPSLASAKADDKFQFERHGYFVADGVAHKAGKPVFNLAVGLRAGWAK